MNLWSENTPQQFWRTLEPISAAAWEEATDAALALLAIPGLNAGAGVDAILQATLGEGQFGAGHFHLSRAKRLYYELKPLIPRFLTRIMRQVYSGKTRQKFPLGWPVEERYVRFLEETLRRAVLSGGGNQARFVHFWPQAKRYALILTHDIETVAGQAQVRRLAEMEADLGLRSSYNFIPERYPLDRDLMDWLKSNGFEIGVHGLKHDGKLFLDRSEFSRRAERINAILKENGAQGFRTPLTHRNPEWMQELDLLYDASFFDTDPFEPISGGTMTIWPFFLGRFVELPYTLVQDYSLVNLLEETGPRIWLEKVDFIRSHHGMALINTHPDYLVQPGNWGVYEAFLQDQAAREDCWHALPRDAARWWRARAAARGAGDLPGGTEGLITVDPAKPGITITI